MQPAEVEVLRAVVAAVVGVALLGQEIVREAAVLAAEAVVGVGLVEVAANLRR